MALALPLLFSTASAQSLPCLHRTVWVSVTDREGAPASGLQAADFQAEFHGNPVKILGVSGPSQKRQVVILLDASGSLGKYNGLPGAWRLSLALASDLAEARLQNTDLALIIFNDKIVEKIDFSSGPAKIGSRLREIGADPQYEKTNVKGKTAMRDAAAVALDVLRPSTNGVIYVITDGGDNVSKIDETELRHRLVSSGTRIYFALVASSRLGNRNRTPEELDPLQRTAEMAFGTGGSVVGPILQMQSGISFETGAYPADHQVSVRTAMTNFYLSMLTGYEMEIELGRTENSSSKWNLSLTKSARARIKDSKLGFARDIPPCKGQP
jgi:hypothetical protein